MNSLGIQKKMKHDKPLLHPIKGGCLMNQGYQPCFHENHSLVKESSKDSAQTISNLRDIMGELRKLYDPKILENCQRTGRVILISELSKLVTSNKEAKAELNGILGRFVMAKGQQNSDEEFQKNEKGNYYFSLNYSRVKIGQKIFQRRILKNTLFHQFFQTIFSNTEHLSNSRKLRKNERSKISFKEKKRIISQIIQLNRQLFMKSMIKSSKVDSKLISVSQEPIIVSEKNKEESNNNQIIFPMTKVVPILVIPLNPYSYDQYMKERLYD